MSNRSSARKNRSKYRTLRKSYRIFQPWLEMFNSYNKPDGNGRIYNFGTMFPKLGDNRYMNKETEDAIRIIRKGGLKRGELAHPQSFSISSNYNADLVIPFSDVEETGPDVDSFVKQQLAEYGIKISVPIPPVWNGDDFEANILPASASSAPVDFSLVPEHLKRPPEVISLYPEWGTGRNTPELDVDHAGQNDHIEEFSKAWMDHILNNIGIDLSQPVTAPAFASAMDVTSLLKQTANTLESIKLERRNKLRDAIKVTSQLLDNFPDKYLDAFITDEMKVFKVDIKHGGVEPVREDDPLFAIALCSVISSVKQTEILFEKGVVTTYVSMVTGLTPESRENTTLVVHDVDVNVWKPTVESMKNRGIMLYGDHVVEPFNGFKFDDK